MPVKYKKDVANVCCKIIKEILSISELLGQIESMGIEK